MSTRDFCPAGRRMSPNTGLAAQLPHPFMKRFDAENFDGQHNLRIAQLALDGRSVDVIETLTPTDQWVKYIIEAPHAGRISTGSALFAPTSRHLWR